MRQRLVWACAQHPRLGGESVAHIVPHELAAMVANWFLDTPLSGKAIGALLAANAGSAEAVRAAGAARLAQLRLQARCAAGALPVRSTVESEWARRMGGKPAPSHLLPVLHWRHECRSWNKCGLNALCGCFVPVLAFSLTLL